MFSNNIHNVYITVQLWSDINQVITHTSGKDNRKGDSCTDYTEYNEGNDDQTKFPAFTKPIFYANLFVVDQFYSVIRNWISKITHLPPKVNAAQ